MAKIILIEDHIMLRDMIKENIEGTTKHTVVGVSSDAKDSVELCKSLNPDLVLMDICTANHSNGIAYSKILKKECPELKIVIMTGVLDLNFINEAKEAKVDSFIYKNISKDSLIQTLKSSLDGYSIYPSQSTTSLKNHLLSNLTDYELKILTLYCKLLDRDEVAEKL